MQANKLFLFFNDVRNKNVFLDHFNLIEGIHAECVFKPVNRLFRAFRKVHLLSGLPGIGIWLLPWKEELDKYDGFVCIASEYSPTILKWLKKKVKDKKCINYYWDNIKVSGYPVVVNKEFENWSFCIDDCKNFKMKFNPQFYISSMKCEGDSVYDVSYVGADRGGRLWERTDLVNKMYDIFEKYNIKNYFWYVSASTKVPLNLRKDKLISEEEYYKIVSKSKAILELVEEESKWITLRPLLALSNGKKLITNNTTIMEEEYYSKENVFIIGQNREEDLVNFINSDFKKIDDSILEYYEARAWSARFFE